MVFKSEQETLPEISPLLKKEKEPRERKRSKPKGSRWTIVILLLLTILASLFFYLKVEAPRLWKELTAPMVISTLEEKN